MPSSPSSSKTDSSGPMICTTCGRSIDDLRLRLTTPGPWFDEWLITCASSAHVLRCILWDLEPTSISPTRSADLSVTSRRDLTAPLPMMLAGRSAVKIGWGYWRILSEYVDDKSFEQELKLLHIRNTFTVYMDPAAQQPAGEDMEWCIISEMMKRAEFERKFPKDDQTEWREGAAGDEFKDWETEEQIRLAEYFRISKRKDTLVKLTDGRTVYGSEFDRGAFRTAGIEIARNIDGKEIRRPTERRQIEWYRLNGTTVVQKVELPGQWIPVIRCEGNTLGSERPDPSQGHGGRHDGHRPDVQLLAHLRDRDDCSGSTSSLGGGPGTDRRASGVERCQSEAL